jgi:hypothetical protein
MFISDLQSRVQPLRSDLPAGYAEQALQDAARWVARKTGIIRTKVWGHAPGGALTLDLPTFMGASAGEFEVLRPTEVMYLRGLYKTSVSLGILTATSLTIPLATVATPYGFYVATVALTASDGVTSYPMNQGDVIQAVNGVWVITPYYKYSIAVDIKKGRLMRATAMPYNNVGYMSNYVVDKDTLYFSPVLTCDVPVSIECSIVPKKEFDTVNFPVDAEDAIIYAAASQYLRMKNKSGGGADLQLAMRYQDKAEGEMSLVRAIAEGGYGDSEMAPPPIFGR